MKHRLAAALTLFALAACSSTPERPPPLVVDEAGVLVLPNGAVIEGLVRAREIHQAPGTTATVTADAMLYGDELILLEGTVQVADAAPNSGSADAASLQLISEGAIVTFGTIRGGTGATPQRADKLPRTGGRGTSILFDSPERLLYGEIRAGDAGDGWAGGQGGAGGSVHVIGGNDRGFEWAPYADKIRAAEGRSGFYGGRGGRGGDPGLRRLARGSGGAGGDAIAGGAVEQFSDLPKAVKALFGG